MWTIWLSEWRTLTRQRTYYTFLLLWVIVFSLLFLLERNNEGLTGYTNTSGTIVNIILYLLPLFMMLTGSFSIANEVENGEWQLICTYPLSNTSYLLGKLAGLFTAQVAVFTLSFGLSMAIGLASGITLPSKWLFDIYLFSLLLIIVFLILGLFIGSIVNTRWKALMASVIIWFFFIMIWPTALIAVLGLFPYPLIATMMKIAMFLNPAEFLRVFLISKWKSGAVFGQSYDALVQLFQSEAGWYILVCYLLGYLVVFVALSILCLRRRSWT